MNIYVGNLPFGVTENDLQELFSTYGHIESIKLLVDKFSGQSKGFGFVDMPNNSEADQAIKGLNKSLLKGRNIKVNQAEANGKKPKRKMRF
jgi:RNA recognition motif-containing protein